MKINKRKSMEENNPMKEKGKEFWEDLYLSREEIILLNKIKNS